MWKEFKRNPDNFVVITASNGVAAIKPYEEMIRARIEAAKKKGKIYDPGGDSTLKYQVIAFTDDGRQVDPRLLQGPASGEDQEIDPTVMKARGGKATGKDMQNPDNIFNLLSDQIGTLQNVYIATSAVEREKMGQRTQVNPDLDTDTAINQIFARVQPVIKTLANQSLMKINKLAQDYINDGDFDNAQKISVNGANLKKFMQSIDSMNTIDINDTSTDNADPNFIFRKAIHSALRNASGVNDDPESYKKWLNDAAKGNTVALKPILDSLRNELAQLTN